MKKKQNLEDFCVEEKDEIRKKRLIGRTVPIINFSVICNL